MGTHLRFAEERRPARRTESPVHFVATGRGTCIVVRLTGYRKRRCAKARVDRSTASTDILAVSAPAHARNNRGFRAFPANCPTEASTCYRHSLLHAREKILIADPTSKSTGPAISRGLLSEYVPDGDATPDHWLNPSRSPAALARRPLGAG
jgi:hypothetical protein